MISNNLRSFICSSKVFQYQWHSQPITYDVMLVLLSFILAWGEAWFFDFRMVGRHPWSKREAFFICSFKTDSPGNESKRDLGSCPTARGISRGREDAIACQWGRGRDACQVDLIWESRERLNLPIQCVTILICFQVCGGEHIIRGQCKKFLFPLRKSRRLRRGRRGGQNSAPHLVSTALKLRVSI